MPSKHNHVFGTRASHGCGKSPCREAERCGQGTNPGGCRMLQALRSLRLGPCWLRAPRVRSGPAALQLQSPAAKARGHAGQLHRDTAWDNRSALVSEPLRWGCLQGSSWARRDSVPSSAPAAAQHEHAADCFPGRRFPAGRKKCSDFPSPQLQKGLDTRAKLLSFTVSSRFEIHRQEFFMGSVYFEKLH